MPSEFQASETVTGPGGLRPTPAGSRDGLVYRKRDQQDSAIELNGQKDLRESEGLEEEVEKVAEAPTGRRQEGQGEP